MLTCNAPPAGEHSGGKTEISFESLQEQRQQQQRQRQQRQDLQHRGRGPYRMGVLVYYTLGARTCVKRKEKKKKTPAPRQTLLAKSVCAVMYGEATGDKQTCTTVPLPRPLCLHYR